MGKCSLSGLNKVHALIPGKKKSLVKVGSNIFAICRKVQSYLAIGLFNQQELHVEFIYVRLNEVKAP